MSQAEFVGRYVSIPHLDAHGVWVMHKHDIRAGVTSESCPVIWQRELLSPGAALAWRFNMPRDRKEPSDA